MQGFRDALDCCRLKYLGYNGFSFTWCNRRPGDKNIWIRLDRGVATVEWILRFPTTRIHHLDCFHFDHKSIILCMDSELNKFYMKSRPFRFEAMWLKDSTCEEVVRNSWKQSNLPGSMWSFNRNISSCQDNLRVWNRNTFGHVRNTLQRSMRELKLAEEFDEYRSNLRHIFKLRTRIEELKNREECMWKQRSRIEWLKEGDKNTRYFHYRANQRNKRNYIPGLDDDTGIWWEDEGRMARLIEGYFNSLFSTSHPFDFDDILSGIQPAISEEMNEVLTREFIADEIQHTLKQMAPTTALGPDGMSPIFYKTFWNIVGNDVTKTVLDALNSGYVHESLNATFIALIPKVKNPKKVSDFRPISLCNVVYKLISKVVVNRLKKILPNIVSDS